MNRLTLAVAGGRKTQSIIDDCVAAPKGRRILVVTYTLANQQELRSRLALHRPIDATVEIQGWFGFLLGHWVRPYLPVTFPKRRLSGLNFVGDPGIYATGEHRFLDSDGRVYKLHLAQLALDTNEASSAAVVNRLSRIYDEIHVDEAQDLNGYDLEVLMQLMNSVIDLHLVGDVRQALLLTNPQEKKNKQYKGANIKKWFDKQAAAGLLDINHQSTSWRSNQTISNFADGLFDDTWGFEKTVSANTHISGHDGLFAISPEHAEQYRKAFDALCLRHSKSSAKSLDLPFRNIGVSKGLGVEHVLIAPTEPMRKYLQKGTALEIIPACSLYVAVTRARSSVAFVCAQPATLRLPIWSP
jgi:hypothetical protein